MRRKTRLLILTGLTAGILGIFAGAPAYACHPEGETPDPRHILCLTPKSCHGC